MGQTIKFWKRWARKRLFYQIVKYSIKQKSKQCVSSNTKLDLTPMGLYRKFVMYTNVRYDMEI